VERGNEFVHGTMVKKEKYINKDKKNKTKERERITSCCVQIESKERKYYDIFSQKYWNNIFLEQQQTKEQDKRNKKEERKVRLSFDDDDVYPDIYNTMIVHDVNDEKIKNKNNKNEIHVIPGMVPSKQTTAKTVKSYSKYGPARSGLNEFKNKKQNISIQPIVKPQRDETQIIIRPQSTKAPKKFRPKKYDIIPKRKSLPMNREHDVFALAQKFEAELQKNKKRDEENKKIETKKTENVEKDPTKNYIYNDAKSHIYDTMIIHDINDEQQSAKIIKPKISRNANKNISYKQQPPKPVHIKPAAANPHYRYNYDIPINTKDKNEDDKKEQLSTEQASTKQMSARDRIKLMNARLQKMQQQT